jgi:pyridoxine 5-phosphate synthase|tara:strand:- start:302 stop:1069 length:768 start_codon:yes stop_codon:yes gene_type:complete
LKKSLSVNLNKVALIRNSREGNYPSVLDHANVCIDNGADGITVHPRPDLRHIKPQDVYDLSALISKLKSSVMRPIELNVEGNPFASKQLDYPGFIELVDEIQPDQCTLVPDTTTQLTSDHGFDLGMDGDKLYPVISHLKSLGIRVSLFVDPSPSSIKLASELGASRIELFTGPYAEAYGTNKLENIFEKYVTSAKFAHELGLGVNAGHDLNLNNISKFSSISELQEVSIGHALIVDAIRIGLGETVRCYKSILSS